MRPRSYAPSILAIASYVIGCGPSTEVPVDAAEIDAAVPVDAWAPDTGPPPPPTCDGTALACTMRSDFDCAVGSGCTVANCFGHPYTCESRLTSDLCRLVQGCEWDGAGCSGVPTLCGGYRDVVSCTTQGCGWDDSPMVSHCTGSATACGALGSSTCTSQPGCHPLFDAGVDASAGIDAGQDAGSDAGHDAGSDAGHDGGSDAGNDAGPPCTVPGVCSPFDLSGCGSGRQCFFSSSSPYDTFCTSAGAGIDGQSCFGAGECGPGLACASGPGLPQRCRRICHQGSHGECGPGSRCTLHDNTWFHSACVSECAPLAPSCDAIAQNCAAPETCYLYVDPEGGALLTACFARGTSEVPVGGSCTASSYCVPGAQCVSSVCRLLCANDAQCGSGHCTGSVPLSSYSYCE